jgi:hypothetical protein
MIDLATPTISRSGMPVSSGSLFPEKWKFGFVTRESRVFSGFTGEEKSLTVPVSGKEWLPRGVTVLIVAFASAGSMVTAART